MDGDNLTDILEISLGLNENKTNTDYEGYSNYDEIIAGSDPTDSTKYPSNSFNIYL